MAVLEKNQLLESLEGHSQKSWLEALDALGASIHEVDREATRIWFAFWPLELQEALRSGEGPKHMAKVMDLEGEWTLDERIDASVSFLYGAHHWSATKKAVLAHDAPAASLTQTTQALAGTIAAAEKVDVSLVTGIAAVGLMMLRIVGDDALSAVADHPASGDLLPKNPRRILSHRKRESRDGLFTFLRGVNRRWDVRWSETRSDGVYRAVNQQDLAMAGASAEGDYRSLDYRRIDGPVPVECRVGSCGYCWVGLLAGKDNLTPITPFEQERLRYFGYDTVNDEEDSHPLVRLACQSQCKGDVTVTIPPWNGELKRRHDTGRDKLGTS